MGEVIGGRLDGTGMKIAVAASRFNDLVVERLVAGATDALRRHGVADDDVTLAWVPGAYELPLLASKLAGSGRYDAVITLGAVIRGATSHYDLVAGQCAAGIARVALDTGIPVLFGVLTTENLEQALERAGSKAGNKGYEAASAAIEMVDMLRQIPGPKRA
ncbi:MAG: 6,7-dimethyl-8-ribityllumazine synthase [Acidimicrobiaceae bacterium]|nr:6,7-dimethyl-8-ribityllumazine synthase [Acidimicrobiaceae bacterium]MBO0747391.1 6,7-dimethyl-8-ribityllumazine synthase [Acidimicrobiaceae bacterium]